MPTAVLVASQLTQRIRLESKTTAQDSYGEPIETWAVLDTVWAEVDSQAGSQAHYRDEAFRGEQIDAVIPAVFRIRHRTDIAPATVRIVYDGDTYNIRSVVELGRNEGLEIYAVAHVG